MGSTFTITGWTTPPMNEGDKLRRVRHGGDRMPVHHHKSNTGKRLEEHMLRLAKGSGEWHFWNQCTLCPPLTKSVGGAHAVSGWMMTDPPLPWQKKPGLPVFGAPFSPKKEKKKWPSNFHVINSSLLRVSTTDPSRNSVLSPDRLVSIAGLNLTRVNM